ncbi:MAG: sugar phosphate isomerase/epimerase [Sediminicola sp.]
MYNSHSRRKFIKASACIGGATLLEGFFPASLLEIPVSNKVPLSGHVWVYSSRFPPNWDCTPVLEQVFKDFKAADLEGMEVMESNLRRNDFVPLAGDLSAKYGIPVTGTSYNADMWNADKHQEILEDVEMVVERLHLLKGSTFGITVGDAGRKKTADELDDQAELLKKIMVICKRSQILPNLHNHTFEVAHDLHDFRGTVDRVPDLKLGPDINWLIRGGVDPVWFINTYGHRMVYLHLRDQDANGKWTRALGDGVTDFPAIADALRKVGFKGRAAIELAFEEPAKGPVTQEWKDSRNYVKKIFGW